MDWISIKNNEKPKEGESYFVSASKGNDRIIATAMYKDNSWYNCEPFSVKKIGEDITDYVIAWAKDTNVFIG